MKLRNKRTGDIWEFDEGFSMKASHDTAERAGAGGGVLTCYAHSLAELNENWEDAEPAEPLIKDEKIRKAVRVWAEANDYSLVKIGNDMASEPNYGNVQIHFEDVDIVDKDKYGVHTIAELCGEEEE